jgi:hypothetical protein
VTDRERALLRLVRVTLVTATVLLASLVLVAAWVERYDPAQHRNVVRERLEPLP